MTGRRPFPSWASNHCKRCKSELQIAADVIFKITSRGLTITRSAFVNERIFFFLTPRQAFIFQASRPFGFVRDCEDPVQESCRCAKRKEAPGGDQNAVTELCRAMGVTEQTYYRGKKQYGGLPVH